MVSIYSCPVCQLALDKRENQFVCDAGHAFDISREGYVNLLLAHHKKTTEPGDSKEMVQGRRSFLGKGHYDPVSDELNRVVAAICRDTATNGIFQILDAGCGEGFYLWKLGQALAAQGCKDALGLWGFDISKIAVQLAARRDPGSHLAVGSTYRLPVRPHCLDAIISVFAPGEDQEFRRILKPGASLVTLGPGPRHLAALRAMVYDTPQEHQVEPTVPAGFVLAEQIQVAFPLHLKNSEDIGNLVLMTPYYWQMDRPKQDKVMSASALKTEVDMVLKVYRKNNDA
jgi:23S rRNA (guanine745-N1)-methyltransferase